MIISHKHKFIFIKTRKTAGTSIEIFLSQFCGKNDILTPIGEGEALRKEQDIVPRHYLKNEFLAKTLSKMEIASKLFHPLLKKSSYLRSLKKPPQIFLNICLHMKLEN